MLQKRLGSILVILITVYVVGIVTSTVAFAQDGTSTMLKNPFVLYALMVAGSLVSMAKQWGVAKMEGGKATITAYLSHFQEIATTLFVNTIAFFGLIDSGTLNFMSAALIGFAANSISDLNPLGARSTTLLKQ